MKRLFILGVMLMPVAGFALDISDCEKIGYWQYTGTDCMLYENCIDARPIGDPDPAAACADMPRTEEECAQQIARQNLDAVKETVLMKCPVTDARLADKNAEKDFALFDFEFVSTTGNDIKLGALSADADFIYYVKPPKEILDEIPWADRDSWAVIGQYEADEGLYMSIVK